MRGWQGLLGGVALALIMLTGCQGENDGSAAGLALEGQPVPIFREFKGQQGPFPDRGFQVVQRPEVWQALWGTRPIPEIDFSRQTVLVALKGRRAGAGQEITITDVRATGQRIMVYISETGVTAGGNTPAVSFPYHMVVVPKLSQQVAVNIASQPASPIVIQDQFLGQQSQTPVMQILVIRDTDAWQRFWKAAFGNMGMAPPVDFTQYLAAVVLLGEKPTAGYSVQVVSAENINNRLQINYRVASPPVGGVTAQVISSPYAIAILPISPQPVVFNNLPPAPELAATRQPLLLTHW